MIEIFPDHTHYFWHKGFIYKLKRAGITGLLLDWLSDYHTSRKQRVANPGGDLIGSLSEVAYLKDLFSGQCYFIIHK